MDFIEILFILAGLAFPLLCLRCVKTVAATIRQVRACTVNTEAEILSWRIETDSDNPTQCTPTIRYSSGGHIYEVEFRNGTVTQYQKDHYFAGDTMTVWIDPENPTSVIPERKGRFLLRSISDTLCIFGIGLFVFLIAVATLCLRFF